MREADFDESSRSSAEIIHFALGCAGVLTAIYGVVIASICLAIFGLAIAGWGVGFFFLSGD